MFYNSTVRFWVLLLTGASALPAISSLGVLKVSTPLPPSQDPFYNAPSGFESALPGAILRLRSAPGNLTSIVGNCSSAYNILYRTTDSQYKPSWAVTTLYLPSVQHSKPNASHDEKAFVSYQFPYNSVDIDSSPSYAFYSGPFPEVGLALGHGWYVNVPDFEGPLASNIANIEQAYATLDSIRAVLSSGLGIASGNRCALWGYSGGSMPSEWALEFHQQYAPEIKISGAALGGLVPNVTEVVVSVGGTVWASHAISGILGIVSQYPDAYDFLLSQLKTSGPYNKTGFLAIKQMSYLQAHIVYGGQNMFDYFLGGSAIMQAPLIKTAFEKNAVMGFHGVPDIGVPMFIYKAIHDEVTTITGTDAYVERTCAFGANILYQRNTVGGHQDEFTNGDPRAFEWLKKVLDKGYTAPTGCLIQNVTVDIVNTGL